MIETLWGRKYFLHSYSVRKDLVGNLNLHPHPTANKLLLFQSLPGSFRRG
jgi:hypothetical protein